MVNSTNPTLIFRAPKCLLHFECDNCVSQWLKKALCFLFTDLFTQTFQTRLLSCSGIWIAYLPFTQYSTMGHWKNNACHRNVNDFQAFTEKSCTHLCLTQCMLRNTKRIRKYWIYWTASIDRLLIISKMALRRGSWSSEQHRRCSRLHNRLARTGAYP